MMKRYLKFVAFGLLYVSVPELTALKPES